MDKSKINKWLYNLYIVISRFLKSLFIEFWDGCNVRISEKVSFELGGFVLCLWFVLGLFWLLGLI